MNYPSIHLGRHPLSISDIDFSIFESGQVQQFENCTDNMTSLILQYTVFDLFSALCAKLFQSGGKFFK